MSKLIVYFFIAHIISTANAQQISICPKLNLGTGLINSKNLKKSFDIRKATDEDIITWEAKSRLGFNFGIGGFIEYAINDQFAVIGELTFNSLNTKTKIDYLEDNLDNNGDGVIETIESEAKIKLSYLQLPVLAKYYFASEKGFYAIGGFGFDFVGTPKIESSETKLKKTYINDNLDRTKPDAKFVSADLNEFNSPRISFILGTGMGLDVGGRNLLIDIRYNHPLTKSEMFTSDDLIYERNTYKNNEVFDFLGKWDAELDAPQHPLNDFKMGTIVISVSLALFDK